MCRNTSRCVNWAPIDDQVFACRSLLSSVHIYQFNFVIYDLHFVIMIYGRFSTRWLRRKGILKENQLRNNFVLRKIQRGARSLLGEGGPLKYVWIQILRNYRKLSAHLTVSLIFFGCSFNCYVSLVIINKTGSWKGKCRLLVSANNSTHWHTPLRLSNETFTNEGLIRSFMS